MSARSRGSHVTDTSGYTSSLAVARTRTTSVNARQRPAAYSSTQQGVHIAADLAVVQRAARHGIDVAIVVLMPFAGVLLELVVFGACEQRSLLIRTHDAVLPHLAG